MHWLQSLDTGLFHFVNTSLANPVFDRLMPLLSGANGVMHWFVPLAVALLIAVLCFGNARARLCALMMFLAVALGDPLVVNTIKHAVARPRPFVTLPDARVFGVVGKGYVPPEPGPNGAAMAADLGSHNSMPSAHAANWFAATMILFLFYRKKNRLVLPVFILALGVSFSRVYNGVHYPSDVLAGMILGAGYAIALAVALESAWQFLGGRFFPVWHAQMPSLLNPEVRGQKPEDGGQRAEDRNLASDLRPLASDSHWLRLGYVLIFAMLVGRWLYIASGTIDMEKDEVYQWLWSKHLALSFYSKPPGIALIQFLGTHIFGDTQFGIRFLSPLIAAILSVMMLRFFARKNNVRAGFCLLLVVTATPLLGIGTILLTIDPPLVLCWMCALIAGWRAAQPDGRTRDWLAAGLAMGLGFLCKYTAFYQIICFGIFFALWKPARIHLRKPGPWLALLIFAICTLPVIIWNSQHHWITINHVAGNAGLGSQWHPTLRYFSDFLLTQAGVLNPIFFVATIWAMPGFWKFRKQNPLWTYFFCMGWPVFIGHLLWSFHSRIEPNWVAPAVIPMFCLMVVYWQEQFRIGLRLQKFLIKFFWAGGLVLGFFAITFMFDPNLIGKLAGHLLPGEKDPLRRVRAWKQTAALVETAREKLAADGKPAFIIADHYGMTGEFTFYLPQAREALKSQPLVYCVDTDEPVNQFYFWPDYDYRAHRKGENAIFISELDPYPLESGWVWKWLEGKKPAYGRIEPQTPPTLERINREFQSVTDLGEQEIDIGDRVFRRVHLWACYNLK